MCVRRRVPQARLKTEREKGREREITRERQRQRRRLRASEQTNRIYGKPDKRKERKVVPLFEKKTTSLIEHNTAAHQKAIEERIYTV